MNLLEEESMEKKPVNKTKKIVLTLLIISTILLLAVVGAIVLLSSTKTTKEEKLIIDGQQEQINPGMFILDSKNNKYISLKSLCKQVDYDYYNGEFQKATEDKSKCYIDNGNEIVGFEVNSNTIYKTKLNSEIEYQYFKLSNKIINDKNDNIYISLKDLRSSM